MSAKYTPMRREASILKGWGSRYPRFWVEGRVYRVAGG